MTILTLPAPAKLNLFLHVLNQRENGYHNIQTVFQLIDFQDHLSFQLQSHPEIRMITHHLGLPEADNLVIKTAKKLQTLTQCHFGCDIALDKHIPMGAGLGGGSSDAATTLLALNKLWQLNLSVEDLAIIGAQIGADVPVFVHGYSAWGEGIGDQLTPLILPKRWYCLFMPPITISTKNVFQHPKRTHRSPKLAPQHYHLGDGGNDFEPIITSEYPEVARHLTWIRQYAPAHLTGTGSTIFASFNSEDEAQKIAALATKRIPTRVCRGVNYSPTHHALL